MNKISDVVNYFQILLNDTANPCMLVDAETLDVVFINYSMKKMLKESKHFNGVNFERVKCYELLHNTYKQCKNCNVSRLEIDKFSNVSVYNENLNRTYRVSNTIVEYMGKKYYLDKFFIASSYVNREIDFNDAISKGVKLFEKNDINDMNDGFLALLGDYYESKKSYVYYLNKEQDNLINHHKWVSTSKEVVPEDINTHIPTTEFLSWLQTCDVNGIIDLNKFNKDSENTTLEKNILKAFNVKSLSICVMRNEDKSIIGFVGISNRPSKTFDYRLLKSTTSFIQEKFCKPDMIEELEAISETDFLTGFYNKASYLKALKFIETHNPENIGVVFININGLRKINEYMGQIGGDKLITKCANILKKYFKEPIYRVSGDEFVCFCIGNTEAEFLKKVNTLRQYMKMQDEFPFSIGNTWKKSNYNIQKLVIESDIVMYINKQSYYHSITSNINDISDGILKDLLGYIDEEKFVVYLQPQFDLKTDKVAAAEALIRRFDNVNDTLVFPDNFVPLYEQKSVIRHIDIFVIEKVCETLGQWLKYDTQIPIAVNLSRVTLMEYDIVNTIASICDKYNVPHHLLIVEVTERVGLIENEVATTLIDEFKENGFKISLDDFGCAYSNIVTLASISVNEVKLDKSLIDNLLTNESNKVIVKSVIDMCNSLHDTHTLAEGIESYEQANMLRELNCTYGQGYYYSRPITIDAFFENYIDDAN